MNLKLRTRYKLKNGGKDMKYKKDNDNRYRVRFMTATEKLMDEMTVKQFISYLEEKGEFEDTDTMYLDGHLADVKVYMLRETKDLRKEFIVTEDGRLFYWLSLIQKIELVDREEIKEDREEIKEDKEMDGMKGILVRLMIDFNTYAELVALNYEQRKEGKCDKSTIQWNSGHLSQIEEYLKEMADSLGVTLNWECKEHPFGYGDWKRMLEYRTVSISFEDMEKLGA